MFRDPRCPDTCIAAPRWPLAKQIGTRQVRVPDEDRLLVQKVPNMQFRPLHDRVVIRRLEDDRTTPGGIIIPDTAKEKPMQGEVLAVGKGARNESGDVTPLDVATGDRILFGKWSGTEVKIDGEELLIMKESDIMAVFENA